MPECLPSGHNYHPQGWGAHPSIAKSIWKTLPTPPQNETLISIMQNFAGHVDGFPQPFAWMLVNMSWDLPPLLGSLTVKGMGPSQKHKQTNKLYIPSSWKQQSNLLSSDMQVQMHAKERHWEMGGLSLRALSLFYRAGKLPSSRTRNHGST